MSLMPTWLAINAILSLAMAIYCYVKNRDSLVNRMWSLCCLSTFFFFLGLSRLITSFIQIEATVWSRLMYVGAIFIPIFFLHFVFAFLKISKKNLMIAWYAIGFFLIGLMFSPSFLREVRPKFGFIFWTDAGPLYFVFPLFFFFTLCYAEILLFKEFQKASTFRKNQIGYMIIGSLIGFLAGGTNFFYVYNIPIFPFGNYFAFLYVVIVSYAIVRYRLMEIDFVFSQVFVAFCIGSLILFTVILSEIINFFQLNISSYAISIFITVILISGALYITPIRKSFSYYLHRFFYKGKFDAQDVVQEVSRKATRLLDKDKLFEYILSILTEKINAYKICVLLFDDEGYVYKPEASQNIEEKIIKNFKIENSNSMVEWLLKNKTIFIKEEWKFLFSAEVFEDLYNDFEKIDSNIIVPLIYKEKLIAIISLGQKTNGEIFNRRDLNILSSLSSQFSQAITNANLYLGALTDSLTQVYNRRYLEIRSKDEINKAKEFKYPLSFILIDIDHFKKINDLYSHPIGDSILKEAAKTLRNTLRKTDILFRYGGEEFAIISVYSDLEGVNFLCERIRFAIEKHIFHVGALLIPLTVSIGFAMFQESMNADQLIESADEALYRAKEQGRNRVCVAE